MGNSRFSDGFLLGMLIGGAAVFLLGTKKGNKILKALTEEGLDGLGEILENLEEKREAKPLPPTKPQAKEAEVEEKIDLEEQPSNGVDNNKSPARRFFRRSK